MSLSAKARPGVRSTVTSFLEDVKTSVCGETSSLENISTSECNTFLDIGDSFEHSKTDLDESSLSLFMNLNVSLNNEKSESSKLDGIVKCINNDKIEVSVNEEYFKDEEATVKCGKLKKNVKCCSQDGCDTRFQINVDQSHHLRTAHGINHLQVCNKMTGSFTEEIDGPVRVYILVKGVP